MQYKDKQPYRGYTNASHMRVGIVAARFNEALCDDLIAAARDELKKFQVHQTRITIVRVAGSVEIPLALQRLARTKKYGALVALGAVIRGETPHFDYVCNIASHGILRVMLDYSIPIGFGVLTTDTRAQARKRIDAARYAVRAAVELAM